MKNKGKMRILALVLCMVVMLSNSSFIFASGETETAAAAPETTAVTPEPEVSAASELAELPTPEPTAEPTEAPTPEPTAEPTPEVSAAPEPTAEPTPEASAAPEPTAEPTPEASAVPEPTEVPTPEVSAAPEPTEIPTSEPTPEASASPTPAAEQDIGSEESAAVTPTPGEEPESDESSEEIVLEGSCGDTTVLLSGPASSFPEGTELSILVQEPAEEDAEVIREAVEKQAEEQEMEVKSYTALDITILKDGKEIQPLGPVNVTFTKEEKEEKEASADTKPDQIKVFHVDEETGKAQDMEATEADEGQVAIETDHFSVYVVVDLDQLGGQIGLTVQHWATIEVLDGVNGQEGLVGIQGPNGTAGDNVVTLKTKNEFCQIYTDDVIKLDNKLNKNVEELSKVLLADANSEIKNYKLKEIWVLMGEGDTADPGVTTKTDDEKNTWAIYPLDDSQKIVTLKKDSTIRMVYEPVKAEDALIQDVTFYDYDVTDGKRYNESGQEDPNGNWLNTTNQGINSASNYNGGDNSNRLAVGQASAFVDHSYNNAKAANGVILNHGGGNANVAKKNIVKDGISEKGPTYNGVFDAGLFNNDVKIGKTILNNYDLVFNQNGDTYTLSAVNKDGSGVLSNLEVLKDIYDGQAWPSGTKQIFSNNFWPLDTEDLTGRDPLMGAYSGQWKSLHNEKAAAASDDNKAHNWFFGMRYSFEFTLGDYTGPLNFYFRGDDDFWLYVDGKLATDLGGIHSSLGEILDLTPYVMANSSEGATEAEKNATHTIEIVYAERGAYGSTCYMQFTLPNVKPVEFDTETPKTSVTVNKVWQDHNNPNRPASIQVELYYRVEGSNGEWTQYDTQTLSTANNWTYTWNNMPKYGYEYKVHEVGEENGKFGKNYSTVYSGPTGMLQDGMLNQNTDGTFSGTITNSASPSTYITVTKVWNDGNNANNSRPDSVDFYLYYRNKENTKWVQYPNGKLTLTATADEKWTGTYKNLPVYWGDTTQKMIYTVMEINDNTPLSNGDKLPGKTSGFEYTVSYPDGYIENDFGKGYEAKTDNSETPQETLNLTVTNSLGVSIKVNKEWKGHNPEDGTVIYAGLYRSGNAVADKWVELKADNNWTATFKYLPSANVYSVKELRKAESVETSEFTINGVDYIGVNSGGEASVGTGDTAIKYVISYSQLTQDTTDPSLSTVTITNQAQWQLIKYSSSDATKQLVLEGAKFELKHSDGTTYKGESDADGIVKWTKDGNEFTGVFPDGNYTLTETKAPTGYALGNSIIFTMKDGVPKKMGSDTGTVVDGIITFYYDNTAIYALPSSGGSGIYKYLFGGVLLMMAASLIVYKNKRREVLEGK